MSRSPSVEEGGRWWLCRAGGLGPDWREGLARREEGPVSSSPPTDCSVGLDSVISGLQVQQKYLESHRIGFTQHKNYIIKTEIMCICYLDIPLADSYLVYKK